MDLEGFKPTAGAGEDICACYQRLCTGDATRACWGHPFVQTNIPQSLMINESVNNIYGQSLNPWNLERTVGVIGRGGGSLALMPPLSASAVTSVDQPGLPGLGSVA